MSFLIQKGTKYMVNDLKVVRSNGVEDSPIEEFWNIEYRRLK